jgi:chromate transporter
LIAIALPPFLVLAVSAIYERASKLNWVNALMRGVSLAVVGITLSVVWTILSHSSLDWRSFLLAGGACALALTKRVNIIIILLLAAGAGYLLYGLA